MTSGTHNGSWRRTLSGHRCAVRYDAVQLERQLTRFLVDLILGNANNGNTIVVDHLTRGGSGHKLPRQLTTPTLSICGALDRCTPPQEAVQFHDALLENGVHSVLVTYPQEGHGVRKLPAAIDYVARLAQWFEAHLGSRLDNGVALLLISE